MKKVENCLKKGVRGAISQKAALGILIDIHKIHLFITPVHEELSKFTEMKVTLEMNSERYTAVPASEPTLRHIQNLHD